MIRNLNQLTLQLVATVPPEREGEDSPYDRSLAQVRTLNSQNRFLLESVSPLWLSPGTGMSVLTILGEQPQHYYLDKSLCLAPGIRFGLSAFQGEATARLYGEESPLELGCDQADDLRLEPKLQIETLYTFFYQEKENGFCFPGEKHPMVELTYVDRGSLHCVVDGQDLLLEEGDLMLFAPNQWHMQYAEIGVAPRFVTLSFVSKGADLQPLFDKKYAVSQGAVGILQNMLAEQEKMDAFSEDMILTQLKRLLITLLREADSPRATRLQASNSIHSENEIIRKAQQYICDHIREKLSVPIVAKKVRVSPSYLTALFHKNLQISPGEYIRRIKLQESKQMIRENNLNFTQIAAQLQYSTVHHFSRQFKEKFGITPSQYAKSVR